jgi:hypothetical protein
MSDICVPIMHWCHHAPPLRGASPPAGSRAKSAPHPPGTPHKGAPTAHRPAALLSGAPTCRTVQYIFQPPECADTPHCSPMSARCEGSDRGGKRFHSREGLLGRIGCSPDAPIRIPQGQGRGKKHTRHTGSGVWPTESTFFCNLATCTSWDSCPAGLTSRASALPPPRRRHLSRPLNCHSPGWELYFANSCNHCRLDS